MSQLISDVEKEFGFGLQDEARQLKQRILDEADQQVVDVKRESRSKIARIRTHAKKKN